ncbi:MAG: HEPN domain-containing protein [Chloroflexi bacterium]|nr:HEPN domain-containing protein [Chloroflexota bacterium]
MYLAKSRQNLTVADTARAAGHLDAAASRAYYAAFQAAVAALWEEGIRPPRDQAGTLSHAVVQSEWSGRLVYRRKLYPPELRTVLHRLYDLRVRADYQVVSVTDRQARTACNDSRTLVEHVSARLGETG